MISELFLSYVLVMVTLWAFSSMMGMLVKKEDHKELLINSKKWWVRLIVRVPAWMLLGLPVMIIVYGLYLIWG